MQGRDKVLEGGAGKEERRGRREGREKKVREEEKGIMLGFSFNFHLSSKIILGEFIYVIIPMTNSVHTTAIIIITATATPHHLFTTANVTLHYQPSTYTSPQPLYSSPPSQVIA